MSLEQVNIGIDALDNNEDFKSALKNFRDFLLKFESKNGEIDDDIRREYIIKFLGEDPNTITEEDNGLIDEKIKEMLKQLLDINMEQEYITDSVITFLNNIKIDISDKGLGDVGTALESTNSRGLKITKEKDLNDKSVITGLLQFVDGLYRKIFGEEEQTQAQAEAAQVPETAPVSVPAQAQAQVEAAQVPETAPVSVPAQAQAQAEAAQVPETAPVSVPAQAQAQAQAEADVAQAQAAPTEKVEPTIHPVEKGDNLWDIVKKQYNLTDNQKIVDRIKLIIDSQTDDKLKERLEKTNGEGLWIGDEIILPNLPGQKPAIEKVKSAQVTPKTEVGSTAEEIVTVKRGDNLWDIVKKVYSLEDNQEIVDKINQIIAKQKNEELKARLERTDGNFLWIGDKIELPKQ